MLSCTVTIMKLADIDYWLGRLACLFGSHRWYHSIAYPRKSTCLKCGKKINRD